MRETHHMGRTVEVTAEGKGSGSLTGSGMNKQNYAVLLSDIFIAFVFATFHYHFSPWAEKGAQVLVEVADAPRNTS